MSGEDLSVSVIVPTWNRCGYLREALASATAQTHPPLEILVVDDGSTDDTPRVVESFGAVTERIATDHRGPSAAYSAGIRRARGDLLALLDDDDRWRPGFLQTLAAALAAEPAAVVAFCDAEHIGPGGEPIEAAARARPPCEGDVFPALLEGGNFVNSFSSALIRRAALGPKEALDTGLRTSMDYELWLRLARRGRFAHVPEALLEKRLHPGNYSRHQDLIYEDRLRILGLWASPRASLDPCLLEVARSRRRETRRHLGFRYRKQGRRFAAAWTLLRAAGPGSRLRSVRDAVRALLGAR